ncbi:MAG: crosslink repair DNA glycosylase YcaQ family protein [Anaerolineae bacterium]|jgi:hypothetical protein
MSSKLRLSVDTVRKLAVYKQGLDRRPPVADRDTLLEGIRRIGLLQLDTISVVARSHYLVMLSRVGLYDRADLDALLYPDRHLFEGWGHAACLIPVEHYEHFLPKILARRERPLKPWVERRLGDDPQGILDAVLGRIREQGPLASRDFEDTREERGTWWDWKPAKTALEVLFAQGHLMVDRREGFQRFYDLAERVLPASVEPPVGDMAGYRRWATLQGLRILGVATAPHVSDHYRLKKPPTRAVLKALAGEGTVLPVEVHGWSEIAYLDPADLPLVEQIEAGAHEPVLTALLSPFDNLIWDRTRVSDLFGFDYRAEMYTPAAKREYGYYVLPILHRGRLVGRLDPKADRKAKIMRVRVIYLEPGQAITGDLVADVAGALREFAAFHGSEQLVIERSEPKELAVLLEQEGLSL